jgi:DNA-binding PadR family transcriptional regulator
MTVLPEKIPGGAFGVLLIGAVNSLRENAYGARISKFLEENGRYAPTPRVYQTLAQLEAENLLTSHQTSNDGPSVRGKPARVYQLTETAETLIRFISGR